MRSAIVGVMLCVGLSGCGTFEQGALLTTGVVWTPPGVVRTGSMIDDPVWLTGPGDVQLQAAQSGETGERLHGLHSVDCVVRADGRLTACAASEPPPPLGRQTNDWLGGALGATALALRLSMAPTDAAGESTSGRTVRVTRDFDKDPDTLDAEIVAPTMLNLPPPDAYTALFPREASRQGARADTRLLCVVSETGVMEGCEVVYQVLFGASEDLGFAAASLRLYQDIRITPASSNGVPYRALVTGVIRWR